MDSITHAAAGATDRRIARRRVGAAAITAFLVLLLFATTRGPAQADPAPAAAPAATPQAQPRQTTPSRPQQTAPIQPPQSAPFDPDPGRGHFGPRDGDGGFGGGGVPDDDGGGAAPAPSTGGGVTT